MKKLLSIEYTDMIMTILGPGEIFAKLIEEKLDVTLKVVDGGIEISSEQQENLDSALLLLKKLLSFCEQKIPVTEQLVRYLLDAIADGENSEALEYEPDVICVNAKGRPIVSKTRGQKLYVQAIAHNTLTFAIGPAGTGKTYLAIAMAVKMFRNHDVSRIILTRPAVEAGENLGFLPGDLQNKVDPYMRPLYDALSDLMGFEAYHRYMEHGEIEVSPLAYMRGRTLDDAFIILDEAQNTTREQMKMFLTRIGYNAKTVVTGDITQIDLPVKAKSGLSEASEMLAEVEDIATIKLNERDVVRNPLVQKIIAAYAEADKKREALQKARRDFYAKAQKR